MAPHSSILAWRIPWTEEPGGLYPRGRKELDMTERQEKGRKKKKKNNKKKTFVKSFLF